LYMDLLIVREFDTTDN